MPSCAGRFMHVMPSGKGIVRCERTLRVGEILYDRMMRPVGKVVDLFGPVKRPFASIDLEKGVNVLALMGKELFVR